eukprot:scaffold1697_cov180-Amphora_coffeaeformis.AAC.25
MSSSTDDLAVPAADVLRLIQAHLTQSGLHATRQALQAESGVGLAAPLHQRWREWATAGQWHMVLQSLASMDQVTKYYNDNDGNKNESSSSLVELLAETHEMAIVEVAAAGDLELAGVMLRLPAARALLENYTQVFDPRTDRHMTRARRLEILLQDSWQQRQQSSTSHGSQKKNSNNEADLFAPFYGPRGRQGRRQELGERLEQTLPVQPPDRLVTLLQQAIKYQSYTGFLPQVRRIWHTAADNKDDDNDEQPQDESKSSYHKKNKKKKRKIFDLVLGTVESCSSSGFQKHGKKTVEAISFTKSLATVKFGKHAVCETAVYTPDGSSLITGSSDGLVEVWGTSEYTLRADLPYQQQQDADTEGLGHTEAVTALAVSADATLLASGTATGEVAVWRLDSGKALRKVLFGSSVAINCLELAPDGSRLLATGGAHCREFGLRTAQRLREYSNGEGSLSSCGYHVAVNQDDRLQVWTAASDGCLRWYDAATASFLTAWRPHSAAIGTSVVVDGEMTADRITESPALVEVLYVSTLSCFLLVPRASQAYLVNTEGVLVRVFGETDESFICTGALSPAQQWFYAVREDGSCTVFDVATGEIEKSVSHATKETVAKSREGGSVELSAIIAHPHKTHMACFSNDKRQKKGQLVVWK